MTINPTDAMRAAIDNVAAATGERLPQPLVDLLMGYAARAERTADEVRDAREDLRYLEAAHDAAVRLVDLLTRSLQLAADDTTGPA